jgi:Asp/Glu/hydantoin racemase
MKEKIALIHTSSTLVPLFDQLCIQYLTDCDRFHISDDSLIKDVIANGSVTPSVTRRVVQQVIAAEGGGATRILVTCSSIGRPVELSQQLVSVPVYRVDQAMADKAVCAGERIGVIATLPTTLEPTEDLVRRRALHLQRSVSIKSHLCEGAFALLMGGQGNKHDEQVAAALRELAKEVDVIVLAQASMARVANTLDPTEKPVPILASPELAVSALAQSIKGS